MSDKIKAFLFAVVVGCAIGITMLARAQTRRAL